MSVMLSFGLALGSLGYKQQVLASSAIASQYAFYVADTALECALYADQQQDLFAYGNYGGASGNVKSITCDRNTIAVVQAPPSNLWLISTVRLPLDSNTRCADITIYKYNTDSTNAPQPPPNNITTYLFSQGYDASCSRVANPGTARFVSRGVSAHY